MRDGVLRTLWCSQWDTHRCLLPRGSLPPHDLEDCRPASRQAGNDFSVRSVQPDGRPRPTSQLAGVVARCLAWCLSDLVVAWSRCWQFPRRHHCWRRWMDALWLPSFRLHLQKRIGDLKSPRYARIEACAPWGFVRCNYGKRTGSPCLLAPLW